MTFPQRLRTLPDGTYPVHYAGRRYQLSKQTRLNGRLIKLYAEKLGGNDVVSMNYYVTTRGGVLKPCEMSALKVEAFVLGCTVVDE